MSFPDKYNESRFNEEYRKEYLLGKAKLHKLSLAEEHELRKLIEKEAPTLKDASMNELIDTGLIRIGIKNIYKNKVSDINNVIDSWGPLPSYPYELIDSDPFVTVSPSVKAYLKKEGDKIKIYSTNVGNMEISEEELGDRIGTGLDFLELLSNRLDTFKDYMLSKASGDVGKGTSETERKPTGAIGRLLSTNNDKDIQDNKEYDAGYHNAKKQRKRSNMSEGPIFNIGSQRAGRDINQAGRDINQAGGDISTTYEETSIKQEAAGDLTLSLNSPAADVLKVIGAIKYKINESDIDVKNKRKIGNHLDNAIVELEDKNPDKKSIADSMKQTNEILNEAKTTGETLTGIAALIGKVAIWLGPYAHSVGLI
jgi:hypothetical protein